MPKRKKIKLYEAEESRLYHLPCINSIDFKKWPDGPWKDELNFEKGVYKDVPFVLERKEHGGWCSYVAIPPGGWLEGLNPDHFSFAGMEISWHGEQPAVQNTLKKHLIPKGYHVWIGYDYNRPEYLTPAYHFKNEDVFLKEIDKKIYVTIDKVREDIKKVIDLLIYEEECLEDSLRIYKRWPKGI